MTVENSNDETGKPAVIKTDVFGVELELPVETAKKIINSRDERSKAFRELDSKVKEYESKLTDASRQAEAQKLALEGKLVEAEQLFAQKHQDKISKLQSATAKNALKYALKSSEEFIGDESALNDALKLILADHSFDVSDDLEVKTKDGKGINDVVSGFLAERPAFRKAKPAIYGSKGVPASTSGKAPKSTSITGSISAGLAKRGM